jgi:predicted SprT family Zn-dependent metalloprotease
MGNQPEGPGREEIQVNDEINRKHAGESVSYETTGKESSEDPRAVRPGIGEASPNREYVTLSAAFDFFNRVLFGGGLPPCLITMQRRKSCYGYYSSKRFEGREGTGRETDEIALNPGTFKGRSDKEILSTLVHEMAHHWQFCFGKPGRGRYHNREWAAKMEEIGLMPSDTGMPGGRKTGQRVTHYVIAGGSFEVACREFLAGGVRLEWQSRENDPKGREKNKTKYTCPACGLNAWAKPEANLVCGDCGEQLNADVK